MTLEPAYAFLVAFAVSITFALAVEAIRSRYRARQARRNTAVTACTCGFRAATTYPASVGHMRQIIRAHYKATGGAHGTPIEHIPEGWDR